MASWCPPTSPPYSRGIRRRTVWVYADVKQGILPQAALQTIYILMFHEQIRNGRWLSGSIVRNEPVGRVHGYSYQLSGTHQPFLRVNRSPPEFAEQESGVRVQRSCEPEDGALRGERFLLLTFLS